MPPPIGVEEYMGLSLNRSPTRDGPTPCYLAGSRCKRGIPRCIRLKDFFRGFNIHHLKILLSLIKKWKIISKLEEKRIGTKTDDT